MEEHNEEIRSSNLENQLILIRKKIESDNLGVAIDLLEKVNLKLVQLGLKNYSARISNIKYLLSRLDNSFSLGLIDREQFESERNRIVWSLIQLLDELEVQPEIKKKLEMLIAIAKIEEVFDILLSLSEGSIHYKEILLLSFRLNILKRELE